MLPVLIVAVCARFRPHDAEANPVWSANPPETMDSEENMILVVDDTAITARWVGYVAGRLGFTPVLAFSGEDALNCLAQHHFVAVISDVEMPGMNGFELLQNIREFYPEMPVILMSASCNEERRRAARACGAQAFLEKPVNADQLARLFGGGQEAQANPPERHVPVLSVFH